MRSVCLTSVYDLWAIKLLEIKGAGEHIIPYNGYTEITTELALHGSDTYEESLEVWHGSCFSIMAVDI